ncbi:MAG: AsmA family protein, partial [Deltaproteobacteria bacterium]
MKRGRRIALVVGGVLLALLVAVAVLAMVLVTPERVRDHLVPLVKEKTGRTLLLDNLDVSLLSGIHIDRVRLVDDQGTPVLGAASVVLRYRFWPLLFGRVMVDRVDIKNPDVRLERLPDGRLRLPWQAEDRPGKPEAEKSISKPGGKLGDDQNAKGSADIDLAVRRVLIEDGRVELYDRALNPKTPYLLRLERLRLAVEDLTLDRAFPVALSARIGDADIGLKGQVDPAGPDHDLVLKTDAVDLAPFLPYLQSLVPGKLTGGHLGADLRLKGEQGLWRLKGVVHLDQLGLTLNALPDMPVRDGQLSLNLDASWQPDAEHLELTSARLDYNGLAVVVAGTLDEPGSTGRIQAKARFADVDLRRLQDILPSGLAEALRPYDAAGVIDLSAELNGGLRRPMEAIRSLAVELKQLRFNYGQARYGLDGRLAGDLNRLEGKGLKVGLGEQTVNLDLSLEKVLEPPVVIKALVSADRLDMDVLLPQGGETESTAGSTSTAMTGGTTPEPAGRKAENRKSGKISLPVEGTLEVRAGELVSRGVVISDFRAKALLKKGVLTIDPLTGRLGKGMFVKTLRCDLNQLRPSWQSTVRLDGLPVDKLLVLTAPDMQGSVTGLVTGHLSLMGRGLSEDQIRSSLGGEGRVELQQTVVSGTKLSRGLVGLLGMVQLNEVDIEQGELNLKIKNGLASLDGVLAGQDLRLEPAGVVDLRG